jgi:hypothetical protein
MGNMSEPDAVPLPREGEVFFDVRGESRTMRLSWYADSSVAVFSIWQGNRCTGTFRLPFGELVRMVETLQAGPPSRSVDQAPGRQGEQAYANAHSEAGYGHPEQGGYGQPAPYGQGPGYGPGPHYETGPGYGYGPDYGYQDAYDGPASPGDQRGGGQYYGDYERPAASAGYGRQDGYGGQHHDRGDAPRYLPDQPGQPGRFQATSIYVHSAPPGRDPGYERTGSYAEPPGYHESAYAGPAGYADPAGRSEPAGYPGPSRRREHHDPDHDSGHRDRETQFLAAPPESAAPYREEAQNSAWHQERHEPSPEPSLSGRRRRRAKTEQATPDWVQPTASNRAR